jgi:phosphate transport system substrate-binding protein
MNFFKTLLLLLCLILIPCCKPRSSVSNNDKLPAESNSSLSARFSISGAYALYPLVKIWSDDFMKSHPGVRIDVAQGGTGKGLEDLLAKKSQLAMISRSLTDSELAEGIWTVPVAKDGVAAIVNQKNPYIKRILDQGLSPEEFLKIFTRDNSLTWGELLDTTRGEKISVFTRKDESGAAEVFAGFLNKESTDLKGTGVEGDVEMIKSIQDNPLGIGFCNFSYAFNPSTGERVKDIQVVPADLDYDNKVDRKEMPFTNLEKAHRGLWLGLYPKNLCRELSIGSHGKPSDPAIVEFLRYVLSEGQDDVKEAGLCELNDVYVGYSLDKLK